MRFAAALVPAILFLASLLQALELTGVTGDAPRLHSNDFKHLWLGGRLLAEGLDPYDAETLLAAARMENLGAVNPYVYPPSTGLLTRWVTRLEFGPAARVWFWSGWVTAWLCVLLAPGLLSMPRPWLARVAGAAWLVGALPFYRQMTAGQMNIAMLAALTIAAAALHRRRDRTAGAALGLAAAFKLTPLYLIAVLPCVRRTRVAVWGVGAFALVQTLALALYGPSVHASAVPVISAMGYGSSTWSELGFDFFRDPFNQSFNSLFHHLLAENGRAWTPWIALGPAAANGATVLVSVVLLSLQARMIIGLRARTARDAGADAEADTHTPPNEFGPVLPFFLGSTLIMLLLPSLMWDHYAVQALLALQWIFGGAARVRGPQTLLAAVAVFALLALPVMHSAPGYRHGAGLLVMSLRLWGVIGLLILVVRSGASPPVRRTP